MELEQKMEEMEKVMLELEQRYVLDADLCDTMLVTYTNTLLFIICAPQTTELGARAQTK